MSAYEELKRFVTILEEVATEVGIPLCVTVVEGLSGQPVLLHRMPGTSILNIEMADRKAYTSAVMNIESGALFNLVQPGQPAFTLTSSSNRLVAFGGGTNVRFGTELYGIGISGGPSDVEDMEILAAAQDRFESADATWADRTFQPSGA
jgi:uncharacterized protein GlcG (DUF336 family)